MSDPTSEAQPPLFLIEGVAVNPPAPHSSGETHPSREQLIAFDRGELAGEDLTRVESHVAGCDSCCAMLENLPENTLADLLRQAKPEPATPVAIPELPAALADHPRYRIVERLGAGGMGIVFKAEHRVMERIVALKIIHPRLVDNTAAIGRFRQEVKAAARLVHPCIVTAYDAEQAGDAHFLVMEFVPGESLERRLRREGRLSIGQACGWMQQASMGLAHAHEQGMVHRDIKPGNLMLTSDGKIKILDFGLARFLSESMSVESLTASGSLVGTPDYIAPEQAADPRCADIRADLYSLGCTLYHLLTGQPPFPHGTVLQKLIAHRERQPTPAGQLRADVPPPLSALIERLMAKEPAERYSDPTAVWHALVPFAEPDKARLTTANQAGTPRPLHRRRAVRWLLFSAAILVLGAGLLSLVLGRNTSDNLRDSSSALASLPSEPKAETKQQETKAKDTKPTATTLSTSPAPPVTQPDPARRAVTIRSRLPDSQKTKLDPPARRDAMIAWFRTNNPEGPESPLAKKWAADLSAVTNPEDDLHVILGPGLVRSKSIACLSVYGDGFFAFELTAEQSARMRVDNKRSKLDQVKHVEPRTLQAELSNFKVVSGAALANGQQIRCSVSYKRLVEATDEILAVRIHRRVAGKGESTYFNLGGPLKTPTGTLNFNANWENVLKDTETGPLIFFVELCSLTEPGKYANLKLVSNTTAALVWIAP